MVHAVCTLVNETISWLVRSAMTEVAVTDRDSQKIWDKLTNKQLKHLVAGGVAGAVSRTCVSPLERLKILYQVGVVYGMCGLYMWRLCFYMAYAVDRSRLRGQLRHVSSKVSFLR